jgi:hypothetical protein
VLRQPEVRAALPPPRPLACAARCFALRRLTPPGPSCLQPEPVFTCARAGGFRVCACGHHFYDHKGLADGEGEASFLDDTADSAFLRDMREPAKADRRSPVIRSGKRHRRRWYWPF